MVTAIGLDFGTTNSALALLEEGSARVVSINNRKSSELTLRSVILIDEDKDLFVGQQAVDRYVAHEGMHGRFLQSLKAFLPSSSFTRTAIFGQTYSLEELIAVILREAKTLGERHSGHKIEKVMLGRPVFFSEDPEKDRLAEGRLRQAAILAGFEDINFEYEPVAATLAYFLQLPAGTEQTVLMGDFGGGTSDFTVMRLRAGEVISDTEKKSRVLSIGGVYVGGDLFDGRIMWEKGTPHFGRGVLYESLNGKMSVPSYILRTLCEWHKIPFLRDQRTLDTLQEIHLKADNPKLIQNLEDLILGGKGFMIFQAIERAKKELSDEVTTTLAYQDRGLTIKEKITRSEFETMIAEDTSRISACVNKVIADANLQPKDIDRVLLTGGSSFVPAVRRIFEELFDEEEIVYLDAFTSVAHGLALSASLR